MFMLTYQGARGRVWGEGWRGMSLHLLKYFVYMQMCVGGQWLSGRVHDSRTSDRGLSLTGVIALCP